ncbi:MAG: hypothetical protein HXY34_07120 [Candidatus Thorarchaeota archaeon]|nr:hypothetical protein [Candidatus Thorarchaeota archaeon]
MLLDVRGPKTLASLKFTTTTVSEDLLEEILGRYYELAGVDAVNSVVPVSLHQKTCYICRTTDTSVLVAVCDSNHVSPLDLERLTSLCNELQRTLPIRQRGEIRSDFVLAARRHLQKSLKVCFVAQSDPLHHNTTIAAVEQVFANCSDEMSPFTKPISIGPLLVEAARCNTEDLATGLWPVHLNDVNILAIVVDSGLSAEYYASVASVIHDNSQAHIVALPASEEDLDFTEEIAESNAIGFVDAVPTVASDLFFSTLAASGQMDMELDEAKDQWVFDEAINQYVTRDQVPSKPLGHQAFFVVDRTNGEPVFSYYYEHKSVVLERAPNVVAAISMFTVESDGDHKTSVFRAGDLDYVLIERENLIFTLVTGSQYNVEQLRERFSFLPELYLDERPEVVSRPDDPYSSPAFTLKLLATLPGEQLCDRHVPYKIKAPDWERFESAMVADFLEAVWDSIDNQSKLSRYVQEQAGPQMTLGALQFLKSLSAIGFRLDLEATDVPRMISPPSEDLLKTYSELNEIVSLADGMLTIEEIGAMTGVSTDVLLHVFSELYKRGSVSLESTSSTDGLS